MRYIAQRDTEPINFLVEKYKVTEQQMLDYIKNDMFKMIGSKMSENIEVKQSDQPYQNNGLSLRHTVELQVFTMEHWVEFRKGLRDVLMHSSIGDKDYDNIGKLILALESK